MHRLSHATRDRSASRDLLYLMLETVCCNDYDTIKAERYEHVNLIVTGTKTILENERGKISK